MLLVITLVVNVVARLIVRRSARVGEPPGRGRLLMAVASGTLSATADGAPGIRRDAAISPLRRLRNGAWWGVCGLAMALLIAPVVWIVEYVVRGAASVWHWSIFTLDSTGVGGGLRNAIVGTLWLTLGVGVLAEPHRDRLGDLPRRVRRPGVFSTLLRSATEVLSGIPSIVFGYCGYLALVVGLHWGFSALPAMIVLALLVVPYVAKSTELALNQVPLAYREGGEALGMSKALVLRRLVMRSAIPGILTGLIIALAISIGETAPLIYTAGFTEQPAEARSAAQPGRVPDLRLVDLLRPAERSSAGAGEGGGAPPRLPRGRLHPVVAAHRADDPAVLAQPRRRRRPAVRAERRERRCGSTISARCRSRRPPPARTASRDTEAERGCAAARRRLGHASVRGEGPGGLDDVVDLGEGRPLQRGLVGDPGVGAPTLADRRVEVGEALVCDERGDLGAEAAGEHVLVHHEEAGGALPPRRRRPPCPRASGCAGR